MLLLLPPYGRTKVTLGFVVFVFMVLSRWVVIVITGTMSSTTTKEEACVASASIAATSDPLAVAWQALAWQGK